MASNPPSQAETFVTRSKVKPRLIPAASNLMNTTREVAPSTKLTPEPTHVPVLQHIGVVQCGIPAEEISNSKLMADQEGEASSSTT